MFIIVTFKERVKFKDVFKYELLHVLNWGETYKTVEKLKEFHNTKKRTTTDYNVINLDELFANHFLSITELT